MNIRIKICGLTSQNAVHAAVEAGADSLGFVFADSPRQVTVARALELTADLPAAVTRVAVMRHPSEAAVTAVMEGFQPDFLQTDHGDFSAIRLRGTCRPLPVYRDGEALPDRVPSLLLYEGPTSGSGKVADWETAALLARRSRLVLAGGLSVENVGEAIGAVRPYGVDVSSGVESEPGRKDPQRIYQFIVAARAAAAPIEIFGEHDHDGSSSSVR